MTTVVGPRMRDACAYVAAHPGCTRYEIAKHIGPRGSARYGYETVRRCVAAGLIVLVGNGHVPRCALSDAGRAVAASIVFAGFWLRGR